MTSVLFRGESWDVEIDSDGGYEPDTNAHDIQWHFADLDSDAYDALNMTADEEQSIYEQLCMRERD